MGPFLGEIENYKKGFFKKLTIAVGFQEIWQKLYSNHIKFVEKPKVSISLRISKKKNVVTSFYHFGLDIFRYSGEIEKLDKNTKFPLSTLFKKSSVNFVTSFEKNVVISVYHFDTDIFLIFCANIKITQNIPNFDSLIRFSAHV